MDIDTEAWRRIEKEEYLEFQPMSGSFDCDKTAAFLAGLGYWFRDETFPSRYVVTETEKSRDEYLARRRAHPEAGFPYTLLISVEPGSVVVSPPSGARLMESWRAFLGWLISNYPCRAFNEFGSDVTADVLSAVRGVGWKP